MKLIDCIQGSDEWFRARLGKVTGSKFSQVLNKKSGYHLYMRRLVAERLTGKPYECYSNENMEAGVEKEAAARIHYELVNECIVEQVGFIELSDYVGVSLDGIIGGDGTFEAKCPIPSTHVDYIVRDKMPTAYIPQVQGGLWVTGRQWCDFVSYCPEIDSKPYFCKRIYRDEDYIKKLSKATDEFVAKLKDMVAHFTAKED